MRSDLRLHSIFLSRDENEKEMTLPERIAISLGLFHACYPDFQHELYNSESGRSVIKSHFDRDVVAAFDRLVPLAYKADLLRYCLLYAFGGVYADLSVQFFIPINPTVQIRRFWCSEMGSVERHG